MSKTIHGLSAVLFFCISLLFGCNTSKPAINATKNEILPYKFYQILKDSITGDRQRISVIELDQRGKKAWHPAIGYEVKKLKPTSDFGTDPAVIAAINGSFFDRDHGGSVTYMEQGGETIDTTRKYGIKWAFPKELINGAVVLDLKGQLRIEPAKTDAEYERSKKENAVLVSGPLLLFHTRETSMPDNKFVNKRHPRTCLCTTESSILLVTIDGRSKKAMGMNLYEARDLLKSLGCIDAINLDGGGSTTMWTKRSGIMNMPSDPSGERDVANAILIIRNQ